jgi:hypothetical protein
MKDLDLWARENIGNNYAQTHSLKRLVRLREQEKLLKKPKSSHRRNIHKLNQSKEKQNAC